MSAWIQEHRWKLITFGAGLVLIPAFWLIAIDQSSFIHRCPSCHIGFSTLEDRIFGQTITRKITYRDWSVIERVSIDLGVPCQHPRLERGHLHRYWGRMYCAKPCINGTFFIDTRDWYDVEVSEKVTAYALENPEIASTFRQRVLDQPDHQERQLVWKILKDAGVDVAAKRREFDP